MIDKYRYLGFRYRNDPVFHGLSEMLRGYVFDNSDISIQDLKDAVVVAGLLLEEDAIKQGG